MSKVKFLLLLLLLISIIKAIPYTHAQTMTFTPKNQSTYDEWEPRFDNTITFSVTVSGLHDAQISDGEVRFGFQQVSRWKGYCMNFGSVTSPDLNFQRIDQETYVAPTPRWKEWSGSSNTAVAQWQSSDNLDTFTIDITVRCKDYGAFGILRASLYKRRWGIFPDAHVMECWYPIPKDENLNFIADKCDADYGYTNPAIDAETGPDDGDGVEENNNPGDGLVQFEEY